MDRLEVPLRGRTLRSTGDTVIWAEVILSLQTNQSTWEDVLFRIDSGTEMSTMLATDAKTLNLPMPRGPVPGLTLQGQEVRSGLLRARIVGMDLTEYRFPCYFVGDPDAPPGKIQNLLGLTGVINQIRLGFDGPPSLSASWGILVVEKT